MDRALNAACRLIEVSLVVMMALMVVMVFGNVVLRYGFNSGITASEEVSRWLFLWMTFLGAAVAVRQHAHLGTDMLVSRLGPAGKKLCMALSYALMIAVCVLLIHGAYQQTKINWSATSAVTEASLAIFSGSCLAFAVLTLPLLVLDFIRLMLGQLREDELVSIKESEERHAP